MKAHFERKPDPKNSPAGGRRQPSESGAHTAAPHQVLPPALPKTALLWGIPADSPALVPLRAAGRLGLALRTVAPQELNAPVGVLCGIPGCGIPGAAKQHAHPGAAAAAKPASPAAGAMPAAPGDPAPLPAAAVPSGPALILCGLPGAEREALLDALRAAGAVIPLKAIVTPTNQNWSFAALLAELAREHAALHGTAG